MALVMRKREDLIGMGAEVKSRGDRYKGNKNTNVKTYK